MDTTTGDQLRQRRLAVGKNISEFAREMSEDRGRPVNRSQVTKAENDGASDATVGSYLKTLRRLEAQTGTEADCTDTPDVDTPTSTIRPLTGDRRRCVRSCSGTYAGDDSR